MGLGAAADTESHFLKALVRLVFQDPGAAQTELIERAMDAGQGVDAWLALRQQPVAQVVEQHQPAQVGIPRQQYCTKKLIRGRQV